MRKPLAIVALLLAGPVMRLGVWLYASSGRLWPEYIGRHQRLAVLRGPVREDPYWWRTGA